MNKGYFLNSKKINSESGEAMPAAIITAIVTSIILLGITIVMSMVLQSKSDQTNDTELTTNASNIDISLRSDITQATFIAPTAKLTQPPSASRLLTASDISLNGITLHIPVSTGECKVIEWSVNGTKAKRSLTIYPSTVNEGTSAAKCDISTEPSAQRTKEFSDEFLLQSPFTFNNRVGRKIDFTLSDSALTNINNELDKELTAQGVDRLSDTDFNKLNSLLSPDSLVSGFADTTACVMNADKVPELDSSGNQVLDSSGNPVLVCPPAETASVAAAWDSVAIAKVNANFDLIGQTGEIVSQQLEQTTSIPLR